MTRTASTPVVAAPIARRRLLVLTVVAPLLLCGAGAVLTLAWLPQVPAEVAVHWGADGVDGVAPAWLYPVLLAAVGLLFAAAFGLPTLSVRRDGLSAQQKILSVTAVGASGLVAVVLTGALAVQRGLRAGDPVPDIGAVMLAGLVAGVLLAGAAWLILPPAQPGAVERRDVPQLAVGEHERLVWMRSETPPPVVTAVALGLVVVLLGVAVLATAVAGASFALLFAVPVLIGAALASTMSWHLRVDERGFAARSALGVPRFRVPLEQIAAAEAVRVEPMPDFGGWGVRLGAGRRTGVVLRAGDAIELTRTDGCRLVVTTDGAADAVGLLEALRRRAGAPSSE